MKRRNLILLLGGASSGAMSVGTGAFSSVEAERGVSVDVVGDDDAYVGYEALPVQGTRSNEDERKEATVEEGSYITLVRVRNQFPDGGKIELVGADVDSERDKSGRNSENLLSGFMAGVSESEGYEPMEEGEVRLPEDTDPLPSDSFRSGHFADYIAKVGGHPGRYTVRVTVRVEGSGVSAEVFGETRDFVLNVEEASSSDEDEDENDGDEDEDEDENDGDEDEEE